MGGEVERPLRHPEVDVADQAAALRLGQELGRLHDPAGKAAVGSQADQQLLLDDGSRPLVDDRLAVCQQALLIPLFRLYREVPLPLWMSDSGQLLDSYWGLILVNTAFQTGFCTFVLSNYMKALPHEMYEAARVDGAGVPTQFFRITLPLCRPALAALATLQVTWIYNEFFWATVLMQSGDKFPITSSLTNLRGQFFTDYNLLSAGSVVIAIPVLVVFFLLQKQCVAGLTRGSTKG